MRGICPECGTSGNEFCVEHKIKVKGGYDANYVQDVCFKCGFQSVPYPIRPVFVWDGRKIPKPVQKQEVVTEDEKITFTARKDDIEISLKLGKEGFIKLLSMFKDG